MSKKPYRVPKKPYRKMVTIGNIVIPSDKERDVYVQFALRSNTACVLTKNGEFIKNCPMVYSFCGINDGFVFAMDYPQEAEELGAEVVLLNMPTHNKPIIIGFMASRGAGFDITEEEQISISRASGVLGNDSVVSFDMYGLQGVMKMISTSNKGDGGAIELVAVNDEKKGMLTFKSNYWEQFISKDAELTVDGKVTWAVGEEVTLISEGEMNLNSKKKIEIGDTAKTERALKGETTNKSLSALSDILQAGTTVTAVGTGSISPATIAALVAWAEGVLPLNLSDKVKSE